MLTRYRSRRDGRSLVRPLTTSHNPSTDSTSTCLTASSSDRLTESARPSCPALELIAHPSPRLIGRGPPLPGRDYTGPRRFVLRERFGGRLHARVGTSTSEAVARRAGRGKRTLGPAWRDTDTPWGEFQRVLAKRQRDRGAPLRPRRRRAAGAHDPPRPGGQSHLPLLARLRAGRGAGADLRLSGAGPVRSCAWLPVRSRKVLLDPYGRGVVVPDGYNRAAAQPDGDNAATAMKSVVVDPSAYDWEGDGRSGARRRRRSCTRCTCAASRAIRARALPRRPVAPTPGLIEKIPYLQELGITAVELLPVFQFDALDGPPGRVNYWGYAPVSFFAPHQAYSSRQRSARPGGRVPRHGKGTAPRRHRGDPRRGVQPHRRGRPRRSDARVPRARKIHVLHASEPDRARYANFSGTRQHAQHQPPGRAPDDRGQLALLGAGDAR